VLLIGIRSNTVQSMVTAARKTMYKVVRYLNFVQKAWTYILRTIHVCYSCHSAVSASDRQTCRFVMLAANHSLSGPKPHQWGHITGNSLHFKNPRGKMCRNYGHILSHALKSEFWLETFCRPKMLQRKFKIMFAMCDVTSILYKPLYICQ
jgi:hypothetical protein